MDLGLSANAKERAEVAKLAIEQKLIPIAMTWNGETGGYIISAVKAGEVLGAKVYKLDDQGTIYSLLMNANSSMQGSIKLQIISQCIEYDRWIKVKCKIYCN